MIFSYQMFLDKWENFLKQSPQGLAILSDLKTLVYYERAKQEESTTRFPRTEGS